MGNSNKNIKELDMTRGNLFKQILVFCLPLVLANLLQMLFNVSDIVVVGQFAGASALGSVGSDSQLVSLLVDFFLGMSTAVNVFTARYFGANSDKDVHETVHTSFLILMSAGVIFAVLGVILSPAILSMMGTKEELLDGAVLYLRIYLYGIPGTALYDWGNGVLSAIGDTKRPLIYLFIAGVVNVVLNLTLVCGFNMGVAGVAIASAVSQWISGLLVLFTLLRSSASYGFKFKDVRFYKEKTKKLFFMSYLNGFQFAIYQIANIIIQSAVNTFDTITVEGIAAAANVDGIVYTMMTAFYTGCSSFIGQNYGAGDKKRMLKSYFISMSYAFLIALVMGTVIFVRPRFILSLFTNDPAVIEAGVLRMKIMAASYCISAFMDCTTAASRGLGRTVVPTILVILGSCVFRVIWVATIFAHFRTVESLFSLYVCSWTLTAAIEMIYFFRAFKRDTKDMKTVTA